MGLQLLTSFRLSSALRLPKRGSASAKQLAKPLAQAGAWEDFIRFL